MLSCLPAIRAAMNTDPMDRKMAAQILSTQAPFVVYLLAVVQPALATTMAKGGDVVPIVNQGIVEVGSSRSTHAVTVDARNMAIEVQKGRQRKTAAGDH